MGTLKVRKRQTLFDVCLHANGGIEDIFVLAEANGLSITDEVNVGLELVIPEGQEVDKDILALYKRRGHIPVTGGIELLPDQEGIGFWTIGEDFIVQ